MKPKPKMPVCKINHYGAFEVGKGHRAIPWQHPSIKDLWKVFVLLPFPRDEEPFPGEKKEPEDSRRVKKLEFHYSVLASSASQAAMEGLYAHQRNYIPDVPKPQGNEIDGSEVLVKSL